MDTRAGSRRIREATATFRWHSLARTPTSCSGPRAKTLDHRLDLQRSLGMESDIRPS